MMPRRGRSPVMALALAGLFCAGAPSPPPAILGEPPLCEPSAALPAPWDPRSILVSDNEVDDSLFAFEIVDGQLARQRRLPLPAGAGPHDIEALAVAGDTLLVVGSHSRNKKCRPKVDRQRILVARFDADARRLAAVRVIDSAHAWSVAASGVDPCLRTLFPDPAPALAREVCQALVRGESEANLGRSGCPALNIEGAVAVPGNGPDDAARIWLGLRSPLLDGAAILLRMTKALDELRFDAVALVDLGGRGVRELAFRDSTLWGIAGSPVNGPDLPEIWRVPAGDLRSAQRLVPARATRIAVPASSEGLAFDRTGVIAVIDGDRGDPERPVCKVPGRQIRMELR